MKNFLYAIAALLVLSASVQPAPQRADLKVQVEQIAVNVLVTNRNDQPIRGLKQEDFRLYEDGLEQEIRNFFPVDAPFSVALVLDTSYSTAGKLPLIQNAAIQFIRALHPDDEVMVVSFDDEVYLETDFTRDKDRAERAVKQTRTGETTQVYEAVYLSLEELRKRPDRKVMVLFSDGVDSSSYATTMSETIEFVREAETTIYSIYFDTERDAIRALYTGQGGGVPPISPPTVPGRNPGPVIVPGGPGGPGTGGPLPVPMPTPTTRDARYEEERIRMQYNRARSYLKTLAEKTGGERFQVTSDLFGLSEIFEQIAEEMRSLYTLAYVSSNPKDDGKFRKIEVRVSVDKARVRHREGYYPIKRN